MGYISFIMYFTAQCAFLFYSNIQILKDIFGGFHICIFLSNPQRGRRHLKQKAKKERVRNSSVLSQVFMKLLNECKSGTIQILSIGMIYIYIYIYIYITAIGLTLSTTTTNTTIQIKNTTVTSDENDI
jgi:hypothetical protein